MDILARVNPRYFAAINLFQANNDARYYLNGVYIEPHPEQGAIIVATNGHILGIMHDPDGFCARPIIVGDITKPLISACRSKGMVKGMPPTDLYISDGGAVVDCGDIWTGKIEPFSKNVMHLSRITLIDGVYPKWRNVLPTDIGTAPPTMLVQCQYLALFESLVKTLGMQRSYEGIRLQCRDDGRSVVVRMGDTELSERFVAVIMQLRDSAPPKTILPDWLMPKEEPQADPATA